MDSASIDLTSVQAVVKNTLTEANAQTPLLKLPGELRNRIYEELISDIDEIEIKNERIVQRPRIALTCSQIRNEFVPLVNYTAPMLVKKTVIEAPDFDFSEVMLFINKLSKEQIRAIEDCDRLEIDLTADKNIKKTKSIDRLLCWHRFCGATLERPMHAKMYHFLEPTGLTSVRMYRVRWVKRHTFRDVGTFDLNERARDELNRMRLSCDEAT